MSKSATLICALFGASAALGLGAGPAAAAPQQTCTDFGTYVYCSNLKQEVKMVQTPSGISVLQGNLFYDASYTFDNGAVITDSGTRHVQYVVKDNQSVEFHDHFFQTGTGNGFTCTFDYDYVYVNGTYRFFSEVGGCVPA